MLELEMLEKMPPFTIFAHGTIHDPRIHKDEVRWIAVRGTIHDWAIYYHMLNKSNAFIAQSGDKMQNMDVIQELVPCSNDAWKMYRR